MNTHDNDQRITQYILNEMTPEEKQAFEQALQVSPELQAEVNALRDMATMLEDSFNKEDEIQTCPELSLKRTRKDRDQIRSNSWKAMIFGFAIPVAALVVLVSWLFLFAEAPSSRKTTSLHAKAASSPVASAPQQRPETVNKAPVTGNEGFFFKSMQPSESLRQDTTDTASFRITGVNADSKSKSSHVSDPQQAYAEVSSADIEQATVPPEEKPYKLPYFEDFDDRAFKNAFEGWAKKTMTELKSREKPGIEIKANATYCDYWIKHPYFEDCTHIKRSWVSKVKILLEDIGKAKSIAELAEKRNMTERKAKADAYYDEFLEKLRKLMRKPDKLSKNQIRVMEAKRKREKEERERRRRQEKRYGSD